MHAWRCLAAHPTYDGSSHINGVSEDTLPQAPEDHLLGDSNHHTTLETHGNHRSGWRGATGEGTTPWL